MPYRLAIPLCQSSTTYTPQPQAHSPYHISASSVVLDLIFGFPYPTFSKRWYTSFLGVGYAITTEPQWAVLVQTVGFAPTSFSWRDALLVELHLHIATLSQWPRHLSCYLRSLQEIRQTRLASWRRDWDSNPRTAHHRHRFSRPTH